MAANVREEEPAAGHGAAGASAASDDASVCTDLASSADGSEGKAARLAAIQEVLHAIFDYYSVSVSSSESRVLTSARFNKLLLDASVIDERLQNAKADLVFAKVCGHASNPMGAEQFLDAVVQLAKQKFPQLPRLQGISKLYSSHFATFTAAAEEPLGGLTPEIVEVMAEARSGLQAVYRVYFKECIGGKPGAHLPANVQSLVQDAWVQALTDYEVLPEFAPKPMVFAAFREISQLKSLPVRTRQQILGEEGQDIGRYFSYVHFALALIALARRCFADFSARSLIRLFQWMDDSKGNVLAAAKGPASGPLRLLGHRAGEDALAAGEPGPEGPRRSTARARGSTAGARSSGELGMRRSLSLGGLRQAAGARPSQAAASPSVLLSRASCLSESLSCNGSLPGAPRAEQLVHQVFLHYAAQGGPLSQQHMTSLYFGHFLRDCGLISAEAVRPDTFFDFVPADRLQQARKTIGGSPSSLKRSSSAGSLTGGGGPRGSRTLKEPPAVLPQALARNQRMSMAATPTAPAADRRGLARKSMQGLPLKVFPQPPLSQVDADLIFVQAIQGIAVYDTHKELAKQKATPYAPKGKAREKSVQRHLMAPAAFALAVQTLSIVAFAGDAEEADLGEMVEEFCKNVLEPLSKILLSGMNQDVADAAELIARDEASLFPRTRPGLERIFAHYARTTQKSPQPHWIADDISRLVRDFGLSGELSQRPLQQIFRCCTAHERFDLKEMNFAAFQLALVVMAQRVHSSFRYSPVDKVVLLFHRMNTAAREESHMGPKPPHHSQLITGLPPLTSLEQLDAPSAAASAPDPVAKMRASSKRQSQLESWAGVLEEDEAP